VKRKAESWSLHDEHNYTFQVPASCRSSLHSLLGSGFVIARCFVVSILQVGDAPRAQETRPAVASQLAWLGAILEYIFLRACHILRQRTMTTPATAFPVSPYRMLQRRARAAGLPANRSANELQLLLDEHEARHSNGGGDGNKVVATSPIPKQANERSDVVGHSPAASAILMATVVVAFALTASLAHGR
jgi:hypothetical protein